MEARGSSAGDCEAASDLAGALDHARERHPDAPLELWGSSYSGALVLRLAAAQLVAFREQGHRTFIAEPGTHGSSMLVEERVGAPVEAT